MLTFLHTIINLFLSLIALVLSVSKFSFSLKICSFPTTSLSIEDVERFLGDDIEMLTKVKERMTDDGKISASEFFSTIDPFEPGELEQIRFEYNDETATINLDGEINKASELDCSDMDLEQFDIEPRRSTLYVCNANFSGNEISDFTFLRQFLFLRVLNLSGNPIKNMECLEKAFENLRYVTDLDLSFISFEGDDDVLSRTCSFPGLKRCNLENCELSTIPRWNCSKNLIELNLSDNRIKSLENLEQYERIECLDLSSNPVSSRSSTREYRNSVLTILPSLLIFDKSRVMKRIEDTGAAAKPLSSVQDIRDKLLSNDTVADHMEFTKDKCSCLEGNPCVSKYVCKDWAHREEIAKAVRLQKGIRDLRGDIT